MSQSFKQINQEVETIFQACDDVTCNGDGKKSWDLGFSSRVTDGLNLKEAES